MCHGGTDPLCHTTTSSEQGSHPVEGHETGDDCAEISWHCITVWACDLKPQTREETMDSIDFTLNHIWLHDHVAKPVPYTKLDEEDLQMPIAAEISVSSG